tara:strand:+ start:4542 stop:5504 length:963 start_codon:yes stop_codon:yes gene_type:complete
MNLITTIIIFLIQDRGSGPSTLDSAPEGAQWWALKLFVFGTIISALFFIILGYFSKDKSYKSRSVEEANSLELINGDFETFHDNGQVEFKYTLRNNNRHGLHKRWDENGNLVHGTSYNNGKEHGTGRMWYKNGQLSEEYTMNDGKQTSSKSWHENGQLAHELKINYDSDFDSNMAYVKKWSENGQKWMKCMYILEEIGNNYEEELHGIYKEWYLNGNKSIKGRYVNGKKHRIWKEWHQNGQLKRVGSYYNDEKVGHWREWYQNGNVSTEGKYVDGKKKGHWRYWHENGELMKDGMYRNGEKIGAWKDWNENDIQQSDFPF